MIRCPQTIDHIMYEWICFVGLRVSFKPQMCLRKAELSWLYRRRLEEAAVHLTECGGESNVSAGRKMDEN